jgi:aspartyl protease
MRPMISGEILADNGSWEWSEFLVDTGADRTVFSAATLVQLGLQPFVMQEGIRGVGGMVDAVIVET